MDPRHHLILVKGENLTRDIASCEVHPDNKRVHITFNNSSTFSSTNSFPPGTVFDYVIVDEASQVDLATGCLALTCAKNTVAVGDAKQLPNVLPAPTKDALEGLFVATKLSPSVNAATNSFLQSICSTLPKAPQTLLKEHYRCHPKIANFLNQKFYGGKLIVLTSDQGEEGVLSAFRTPPGNHERDRTVVSPNTNQS
jgi:superfamily I DNA and/or RNA helicase